MSVPVGLLPVRVGLLLTVAVTAIIHPSPADSLVQFSFQEVTASELQEMIDAPIERSGGVGGVDDLDSYLSVRCVTERRSARPGFDYVDRADEPDSAIVFFPGERTKSCGVRLLDDADFEPTETFVVRLKNIESDSVDRLGPNSTVLVRIINDEDTPIVQFQRSAHSIREPYGDAINHVDTSTSALLAVIRTGDQNHTSEVVVRTEDGWGTAAGLDYRSINKVLTFLPGDGIQFVEIDVLLRRRHIPSVFNESVSRWGTPQKNRIFQVKLLDDQRLVNAKLGNVNTAAVTILKNGGVGGSQAPLVISLLHYDDVATNGFNFHPPPAGHPLVCVTPCDSHFPGNEVTETMSKLCANAVRLNETSVIRFSWEVAARPDNFSANQSRFPLFRRLVDSIFFARVDSIVLDSIHFRPGFLVRCVVQSMTRDGQRQLGLAVTSRATLIGDTLTAGSCRWSSPADHVGLQSESFVATLKYSAADETTHANRLHVHVEIPHQDGLLPLVSTRPLHNPALLLLATDPVHRSREHPCSNLIMPGEKDATLNDGFLKYHDSVGLLAEYPHEHDATLRSNETLILYRHLNRHQCRWTFDAWYHMAELVDLCGGYTLVQSPQIRVGEIGGQTTVRVPLYVSYVFSSTHRGWTTIERHTEMDFTFEYSSVLWNSGGLQSMQNDRDDDGDSSLGGTLHVQRIGIGEAGKMVVDFQTTPNFRGFFLTKHPNLEFRESRLIPPSNLILSFDLQLLWTAQTYDAPTQTWRAVSNYSLKDYTGTYVLELIPCTVCSNQAFFDLACTPHPPQRFVMPIEFQQTNRPVAVVYSLNTHFQLLNDESAFLSPPSNWEPSSNEEEHSSAVAFSKGETILGRVLWDPEQDLRSAYRLKVKRVYGCTGRDGYVPVYDPSGEEYDEGAQFGCIRPSKRLGHRIVLLDRSLPESPADHHHHRHRLSLPAIEAKFVEDVPKYREISDMPGVDGFVVPVNSLYRIEADQRWFLQAVYTIEPSAEGLPHGRSTRSATWTNGTNIRSLWLIRSSNDDDDDDDDDYERSSSTFFGPIVTLMVVVVVIMGCLILMLATRMRVQADCHDVDIRHSTILHGTHHPFSRCVVVKVTEKPFNKRQRCDGADEEGTEV